jgi:hypothetical protein
MMWQSGGFRPYWSSLVSLWRTVPAKQTVLNSSPVTSVVRLISIAGIYVLCFGCAAALNFIRNRGEPAANRRKKLFIWVWVTPGVLFFTFVFLKFVNSGYLLVISPPVFCVLGLRASNWYAGLRFPYFTKVALTGAFALVNSLVFFFAPVYCSYASVRRFEGELRDVVQSIPQIASPQDTMIVGLDSHFLGYRHAGYYLPNWFTAEYPEVRLFSGLRVFAMEHGETRLIGRMPSSWFKRFLLFPLPSDDPEYREYMAQLRARFPAGALQTVRAGGREYTLGASTDLSLLFPSTTGGLHSEDLYSLGNGARFPVARR